MATLAAHHLHPKPIALLSITGITTFRHPFFNSSVLLTPRPILEKEIHHHLTTPISVGVTQCGDSDARSFDLEKLLPSGAKNPDFKMLSHGPQPDAEGIPRGCLYDFYLYNNKFVELVGDVDPGYDWPVSDVERRRNWPPTIIIQGNADVDVDMAVSTHMVDCLGPDKVRLCLAEGEEHSFEAACYLEDDSGGMDAVRFAVSVLDDVVARA
jgi:hypothetical protein